MKSCSSLGRVAHADWFVVVVLLLGISPLRSGSEESTGEPKATSTPASPYSRITVVDEVTGRGVPCVRLKMTNEAEYWTDNAGVVAFCEPDLMGREVYFEVMSHGYSFPKDGWFGFQGRIVKIEPGGSVVLPVRRDNIAQRLYRMTGAGLYRDSMLLGDTVPAVTESAGPPVAGQDGGDAVLYKGQLFWFWGDTGIPRFPLGVFRGTGAISDLPGQGGLDPEVGIAYRYLRNENGEPRPIFDLPDGVYWYSAPRVVRDAKGQEHLLSDYAQIAKPMREVGRGLAEYNDETGYFEPVMKYPADPVISFKAYHGLPFRYRDGATDYSYYPAPYPCVRGPVDYESQTNLDAREAFTCLKEGSRFDGTAAQLDRDAEGNLTWGWKRNTSLVAELEMDRLVKAGAIQPDERWYAVEDFATGSPVFSHSGSICWNEYRQRWVCIRLQHWGSTLIGETWYLEGDTPMGPWVYATKIVTHAWKDHDVSFYIAAQIPEFDKDGGREIFFKGSFSAEFGSDNPAPRHNYNNFMYKLELDDPRLFLPVPVYRVAGRYGTKQAFDDSERDRELVWYAPDRPREGTVAVYQEEVTRDGVGRLRTDRPAESEAKPVFYAVPAVDDIPSTSALARTIPLYEYVNPDRGERVYAAGEKVEQPGFVQSPQPVCRVWPAPIAFNPYRLGEKN